MKLKPRIALLTAGFLIFAGLAWAVAPQLFRVPVDMRGGFWAGSAASQTSTNRTTGVFWGTGSLDFDPSPATLCSPALNVITNGGTVGDPCIATPGYILDAGTIQCQMTAANTASLKHCSTGAGYNPDDAGFKVVVFSNQ